MLAQHVKQFTPPGANKAPDADTTFLTEPLDAVAALGRLVPL
eukprot:CAMPEP_0119289574 /NCGR_PEP_ID=MMETSP1329-20130426/39273_1 /TAXON_ID=114041 /ORGANISM="Genus nov. species nov., Strain RCC1024" /LENGTH=41 /DNA_ID= /DNA_START= /DNA_END= /DNA_ORIENTATION=